VKERVPDEVRDYRRPVLTGLARTVRILLLF
jgi:hypothetical protein